MKKSNTKNPSKPKLLKSFKHWFFSSGIAFALTIIFLLYGPIDTVRDLIITSAMTTLSHKYLATRLYSKATIEAVLAKNKVDELGFNTDANAIDTAVKNGTVKLTKVKGSNYNGWLLEISDLSWVRLGVPKSFGEKGQKLPYLVTDYNAIAGINAGGFADANGFGNGGYAMGIVVVDGTIVKNSTNTYHNLIGFNNKNVLVLGKYTTNEIKAMKIRDAVEFTPFLIINGTPATMTGNGGWGYAPRTAIGQRKDGTVLFLVIDGRSLTSAGCTMKELQRLMIEYGAYNAANLDGGSSTVMSYNGEIVNKPSGSDADGMRFLPNAFLVCNPKTFKLPTDRVPYTLRNK